MGRIVGIVQARMGSTRLPGKVLKKASGVPLLQFQLRRLRSATELDDLVVATTELPEDDAIVAFCQQEGVNVARGSAHDVLDRYLKTADQFHAESIVRLTADCPLIDPALVDQVVRAYRLTTPRYDYFSNTQERGFPRGMDVEVFSFSALEKASLEAHESDEREHVTLYFYRHPERFSIGSFVYRLTVDTEEDFAHISRVIEEMNPDSIKPSYAELVAWMQNRLSSQ